MSTQQQIVSAEQQGREMVDSMNNQIASSTKVQAFLAAGNQEKLETGRLLAAATGASAATQLQLKLQEVVLAIIASLSVGRGTIRCEAKQEDPTLRTFAFYVGDLWLGTLESYVFTGGAAFGNGVIFKCNDRLLYSEQELAMGKGLPA